MLSSVFLLVVSVVNPWFFKIFSQNIFVAFLVLFSTALIYYLIIKKYYSKILLLSFSFSFLLILFVQIKTTNYISPFQISAFKKDFQQTRMNEYPPQLSRLSYWLDGKKESIIFFNLLNNFFEPFDFTQYFFTGHFPLIYFPLFIFGVFKIIRQKDRIYLLVPAAASIFVLTVIGKNSPYDMFCFYPIISISIVKGLNV